MGCLFGEGKREEGVATLKEEGKGEVITLGAGARKKNLTRILVLLPYD